MSRQDVRTINELWQTSKCTRNNFDEDMLLDTLEKVRTARSNNMISDFDSDLLECYLLICCSKRFRMISDLDLFQLALQTIDNSISARQNGLIELQEYHDNIYYGLYDLICNKGLSKQFDVYILSATIAHRKD